MDTWRPDTDRWLASELEDREDAAEAAFAQAFRALPRIEPGVGFADRVVRAAWRMERRRHRAAQWRHGAIALPVMAAGLAIAYQASAYVGTWMATAAAAVMARGVVGFLAMLSVGVTWWSFIARVGASMGSVVGTPRNTAALLALDLFGMLALWALQRLLSAAPNTVNIVETRT